MTGRRASALLACLLILATAPGCGILHQPAGTPGDPSSTWCGRLSHGLTLAETFAVPAVAALAPAAGTPLAVALDVIHRLGPAVTGWCSRPADAPSVAQDAADLAQALAGVLAQYQAMQGSATRELHESRGLELDVATTRADLERLAAEAKARAVKR